MGGRWAGAAGRDLGLGFWGSGVLVSGLPCPADLEREEVGGGGGPAATALWLVAEVRRRSSAADRARSDDRWARDWRLWQREWSD